MNSNVYTPVTRYNYLKDENIEKVNRLYPYLHSVYSYIHNAFNKDFE